MNTLHRRLLPLHLGIALQGFVLWFPIEKLFMSEIGFDAAAVGVMAAGYAAVVPLLEVPSGILADRWSRRGVLTLAGIALALCSLAGGLSDGVVSYTLAVLVLGVHLAMYSGTLDAMVYDTVLEETGGSEAFERRLGLVRFVEGAALVAGSLAGGWLAGLLSPRATYFLTVPFAVLSVLAFLRFREPTLHRSDERVSLRTQLGTTVRALNRRLLPVVGLAVLAAVLLQALYEFGPLWMVAVAAPAVLFGPYWAALMATIGLGGLLAGRFGARALAWSSVLLAGASVALLVVRDVVAITVAQVVLGLLLVVVGVHVSKLVNDAVPSTVRAGVVSGVSSLTWLAFLPFSLLFGFVSDAWGAHRGAVLLVVGSVGVTVLLAVSGTRRPAPEPELVPA